MQYGLHPLTFSERLCESGLTPGRVFGLRRLHMNLLREERGRPRGDIADGPRVAHGAVLIKLAAFVVAAR